MSPGRLERWVRSGLQSLQWDQLERCLRMSSLTEAECRRMAHLPMSSVAVYVSEPRSAAGNSDKVLAILPDSSGGSMSYKPRGGFSVSQALNGREGTHRRQQLFPGSTAHDAVLVLDPSPGENFGHPVVLFYVDVNVTKKRCSHLDGIYLGEECLTLALKGRCQNQLKRRQAGPERLMGNGHGRLADHAEFARCPQPLPMGSPSLPVSSCELNKNTRRCHQQPLATHLSCRLYQTCDHAVLISGGWQQQMTFQLHVQNLQRFYRMLQNNGFHKEHIKTFFASSGHFTEDLEGVYSATEKAVIRNHVSYADLKERYSVNELLADLAGCRATRVLLFVDQSYSGVLSKRLRGSQKHLNGPGISRLLEPWAGLLNVTLAGAPCNATPPLTDDEMRREYQGCQNLPTALWHQKHRRTN
ncbi:hypothetical protein F7725_002313 [Dissostichus mawsoni]|uniref:Uncharacterized protein n=1 Tax=Dissostichus mawsoni TaxID=36200 RepID=A0A7J5Y218_DISMA|nr:hypothetical protein F7725_002313 [Dissostichus mawsoni]